MSKLIAPLAVFGAVLVAMVALNDGATAPPALSAERGPDYAALGNTYLARARATGDPGFYSRAERAFRLALRRDPAGVDGLVGAGTLAGLRHDFGMQLRLGHEALRAAPDLARPLTVIADAQIELGRYTAARRSIQRLVNLKPSLPAYARVSYFRELHGDLDGAIEAMRYAVSAGGSEESAAYVETLLGDLELLRGHIAAARAAYRTALRDVENFPQALTGLARTDAAGGDLRQAAARLRRSTARLPLTSSLTLLAEVETGLAREAEARPRSAEAASPTRGAASRPRGGAGPTRGAAGPTRGAAGPIRGAASRRLGGAGRHRRADATGRHRRAASANLAAARVQYDLLRTSRALPDAEAVLFEANHGSARRAVRLGRRVWRLAPSIRSADALGWAFTRAGRPRAGLVWARRALRTGSIDPLFRLHAGVSARRAGRRSEAERYLTAAVKGAAALSPASIRLLEEAQS